jgi:phage replication O-like protein O
MSNSNNSKIKSIPSFKISAPNHTQTPNICFDEIFKTLKEGELRVILVLIRQTFGWHKTHDRISLKQLSEKTGMLVPSVCRSLASLIEKGLVVKNMFGKLGKERVYYSIVVERPEQEEVSDDDGIESEEEMELISNNSYLSPKDSTPLSLGESPSLLKIDTKETIQKKQQVVVGGTPPPSVVENNFCKDDIHFAKSRLNKDWTEAEIEESWKRYQASSSRKSDPVAYVEGIINKLRINKQLKEKNKCPTQKKMPQEKKTPPSQSISKDKDSSSDKGTSGRILADWWSQYQLKIKSQNSSINPKTS